MLALNRRVGQEVLIGSEVKLVVLSIQGNAVRLGFIAPEDVRILRTEAKDKNGRERNARIPR